MPELPQELIEKIFQFNSHDHAVIMKHFVRNTKNYGRRAKLYHLPWYARVIVALRIRTLLQLKFYTDDSKLWAITYVIVCALVRHNVLSIEDITLNPYIPKCVIIGIARTYIPLSLIELVETVDIYNYIELI